MGEVVKRLIMLATFAVALSFSAVAAGQHPLGKDPRVCMVPESGSTSTYVRGTPRQCTWRAAWIAFREGMSVWFGQDAPPGNAAHFPLRFHCQGFVGWLRWRCSWHDSHSSSGWALVTLGKAPRWKPSVTVRAVSCVDPSRQGCHLP